MRNALVSTESLLLPIGQKRACGKPKSVSKMQNKVKSLWANGRFVIALHSPCGLPETAMRLYHPEKSRDLDAIYCRVVRSLQFDLSRKNREKWASFAYFGVRIGRLSLQSRLRGGARSLALNLLRRNSLLTGKITGNSQDFTVENRASLL